MSAERPTFSRRTLVWVVGIALASFLLAFVLSAVGDDLGQPGSAQADTFSHSALGHRALFEFLERSGLSVSRRRSPSALEFRADVPLIVAEPHTGTLFEEASLLELFDLAERRDAPFVLVLPKRLGHPDAENRWVERVVLLPLPTVQRRLAELVERLDVESPTVSRLTGPAELDCSDADGAAFAVELRTPQLIERSPGIEPLVRCGEGQAVLVGRVLLERETPGLYVISDPDVLNTQGLGRADHAALVRRFVAELDASGVVFDETSHGFTREATLISELLSFPLIVAVLHGTFVLGLVVWAGAGRFGKPLPVARPRSDGKRVLIDNAAQLLSLGGHSAGALASYFETTLRAVGAHYFFPPDLALDELLGQLQQISNTRRVRVDLIGLREQTRRVAAGGASAERAVRLAGRLHRWRQEITDGSAVR